MYGFILLLLMNLYFQSLCCLECSVWSLNYCDRWWLLFAQLDFWVIVDVHILWCTWGCSSWMWTGIRGDVRNPLSDVTPNSVLGGANSLSPRSNSLRGFRSRGKRIRSSQNRIRVTSLRGFLTSPRIPVHIQLLHPQVHHRMWTSTISEWKSIVVIFLI